MSAPDWGITFEVGECPDFDALTAERQAEVIEMATDFLWHWTNRIFGTETVVLRPCRTDCGANDGAFPNSHWQYGKIMPVLIGGQWQNIGCGKCGDTCGCNLTPALRLPGPVASVEEVLLNGVALAAGTYRVDDYKYLVRLDGEEWPTCQNMLLAPTEDDTWQITYTRGTAVPAGGLRAAKVLACQFAKAIAAPKSCDLPQRIQQITRQGVTVTVMDDFKNLVEGGTGIWLIDSWVASVTRPAPGGSVRSVDVPRPRYRRTTWGA